MKRHRFRLICFCDACHFQAVRSMRYPPLCGRCGRESYSVARCQDCGLVVSDQTTWDALQGPWNGTETWTPVTVQVQFKGDAAWRPMRLLGVYFQFDENKSRIIPAEVRAYAEVQGLDEFRRIAVGRPTFSGNSGAILPVATDVESIRGASWMAGSVESLPRGVADFHDYASHRPALDKP